MIIRFTQTSLILLGLSSYTFISSPQKTFAAENVCRSPSFQSRLKQAYEAIMNTPVRIRYLSKVGNRCKFIVNDGYGSNTDSVILVGNQGFRFETELLNRSFLMHRCSQFSSRIKIEPYIRSMLMKTIVITLTAVYFFAGMLTNSSADDVSTGLIKKWAYANDDCRGRYPDDPLQGAGCKAREIYAQTLESLGYCYGKDGQFGYQYQFHKCGRKSIR